MLMSLIRQRRRKAPGRDDRGPAELAPQPFSSADVVLLCSFGPDLSGSRTHQELQSVLMLAGYRGVFNRYFIAASPLLDRRAGGRYVLHRYAP
jgi:hypothetical protein